ncbi:MAG: hypothetical protein WBL93_12465 [Lutisporaceae bacterium]
MKKSIWVMLLIICLLCSSFIIANAEERPSRCPECGFYSLYRLSDTNETLISTTPCSHHSGYYDKTYSVEEVNYLDCSRCSFSFTTSVRTWIYVICGFDGTVVIQ